MKKKILFVTYGGGHVNMVFPVVKSLLKLFNVEVLALTTSREFLEKQGIRCFSYRDFDCDEEILNFGSLLSREIELHSSIPKIESIKYLGLCYNELVEEYGELKAKEVYTQKGRHSFLPVKLLRNIIENGGYDLVVTTNSPRSERAAIMAAGELGVPSICMVDLMATQGIKWIGRQGYATKVCVISDYVKKVLLDAGRLQGEVVVTGNPAFDSIQNDLLGFSRSDFRSSKGWSDSDKIILWASNIEPAIHPFTGSSGDTTLPLNVEKELIRIVSSSIDLKLVIRPHPNDTRVPLMGTEGVSISNQKENLIHLLASVDCVVVMASTVGLQAKLVGRPLISITSSIFSPDMPYEKMGLADGVADINQLKSALDRVVGFEQKCTTLPFVGEATSNVVNVIKSLISK